LTSKIITSNYNRCTLPIVIDPVNPTLISG